MAAVYLGTVVTPAGERKVALKRLLDRGSVDQEQLIAEAKLVFQLTHANICQVLDLATSDEGTFLVMEYVDGCDLGSLIEETTARGQPLDVPLALHIIREVAQALDYAHRRTDANGSNLHLVHGDVKPQNILLSSEGEVKLADFGIARALGTGAPGNRMRAGTPGFIAPEVLRDSYDQRADVYSLGVTLYAALRGQMPGSGTDAARLDFQGLSIRPQIDLEIVDMLERATAFRPADRYQSASDFGQVLATRLAHRYPTFTPARLAEIVRFNSQPARERPELDKSSRTLVSLTQSQVDSSSSASARHASAPFLQRTRPVDRRQRTVLRVLGWASAVASVAILLGIRLLFFSSSTAHPQASAQPAGSELAKIVVPFPIDREPDQVMNTKVVSAQTGAGQLAPITKTAKPRESAKQGNQRPAKQVMGYLTVNADPWGAVYVDGERVAEQTPIYRLATSAGRHRVEVINPESRRHSPARVVEVPAGQNVVVGLRW